MNSIRSRRKATQKVKTCPTPANRKSSYHPGQNQAHYKIYQTQILAVFFIVSKINSRTSIKKVWTMVRKITGKPSASPIRHLNVNNVEVSDFPDIADTIAQTFSNNSSPENYSNKFQSFRRQAGNQQLKFKSRN